jgi:diadenosine tetraphosphate (Ap4A) HIT family hydrolase
MLRTIKTREAYANRRKEVDTKATKLEHLPSIREWALFRLVENEYPYDKIAKTHHMLLPKNGAKRWEDLSGASQEEFHEILEEIGGDYNFMMLALRSQSVPSILHWHFIETWDRDEDFKA